MLYETAGECEGGGLLPSHGNASIQTYVTQNTINRWRVRDTRRNRETRQCEVLNHVYANHNAES
jgi:hypothetical protein